MKHDDEPTGSIQQPSWTACVLFGLAVAALAIAALPGVGA
jgi:hypothetical protein